MNNTENKTKSLKLMISIVVSIWVLSGLLIYFGLDTWDQRGTFGDLFGAVNSLFSGLAFAGLMYTIFLTQQDLEIQRKEVYENRKQLIKSAKAQQKSEKALAEQVEQMKIASRLDALKTLIGYYNLQIANINNTKEVIEKAKQKRKLTIQEIEELIDRIDDDVLE
ncbi:hypothetical protein [Flammeovirga sp. EKP202]|uniref:hypothetical protein n=1 Tax=Flammeovirga sp. EKP202 TaxID=2770592 RepID=UPI00165F98D6|nr:hypothetical protein [Flammeovirga sp. EKP202]MBD0399949.1 hypothetical protein [Flammeovirga sp. EKP202]